MTTRHDLVRKPHYINDHQRCIICYVFARRGVIKHANTCPSRDRSLPDTRVRIGATMHSRA